MRGIIGGQYVPLRTGKRDVYVCVDENQRPLHFGWTGFGKTLS